MQRPVANGCLLVAAITFVLLAAAAAGWAQQGSDAVGRVIVVRGAVTVTRAGASAPAQPAAKQALFAHDRIETGKQSTVKALFRDDSLLTVGEQTRLELADYVYDADRRIRRVTLVLAHGVVRALVGQAFADPASVFSIQAGSATAVAHATYFVVWIDQEGTGVVNIGTAGPVQFSAGGQTVMVKPGHFSVAPVGQAPRISQPATDTAPASVGRAVVATDVKEDVGSTINQLADQTIEEELPSCPPGSPPGGICPRKPPPTGLPPATPPAVTSGAARR